MVTSTYVTKKKRKVSITQKLTNILSIRWLKILPSPHKFSPTYKIAALFATHRKLSYLFA